ncbi:mannitol-1-phosphate 5-dehydrogenase [Metabacillus arenae]|uniref:Mannitol-1-phosphate 5-dehydrogenase n=1 Tax=Metabacillus arenae TaxID=2771434 RepID=A0A926NS99_9BACI|nr:mannitol-1-phosphate 5-dehydrogenase [Metabacillus arenae]MBD1383022.1 mannitol-1-phosphate 5-dehydrogenase [Metabacillus arenae]
MIAVHFGAGNIGRGFIGAILSQAGYEVTFVDINEEVIQALNERNQYEVELASDSKKTTIITDVKGINSEKDPDKVIEKLAQADLITTAVGPNILKFVAKSIADGLKKRLKTTNSFGNIIACENMIGGTAHLQEEIEKYLNEQEKEAIAKIIGFPNSAVDRIVPIQEQKDLLKVSVEPFFEWVVEEEKLKGDFPKIPGVTYVKDLIPYIERKLYTVNTGHAVTAYVGYDKGLQTVKEAIEHPEVRKIVEGALQETSSLLTAQYSFDKEEHQTYISKILSRFENQYISDELTRVGRSPIRKLGYDDRLVGPARKLIEIGKTPEYLATGIAAALNYHYDQDPEAVQLAILVKEQGIPGALSKVSDLPEQHSLVQLVTEKYAQ